jgi:hypothetical protein
MNVGFVKELFFWFTKRFRYWHLTDSSARMLVQRTARRIQKDGTFRARVEKLVHDADFGIDGFSVEPKRLELTIDNPFAEADEERRLGFERLRTRMAALDKNIRRVAQTRHRITNSQDSVVFSLEGDESSGTQRFFGIIGAIHRALDRGDLLIVDELDCSMHPQLTRKLVEMFHSEEFNPKGAQLIFATHDTNLMTPSLFRRDQIWLTEKTKNGNTELFSLTDIESEKRPRKDEPFEKNYLAGRYGGVPTFGPALEDLGVQ